MEIDILWGFKKKELIYIVLCKFEDFFDELCSVFILKEEIIKKRYDIVYNLWELMS